MANQVKKGLECIKDFARNMMREKEQNEGRILYAHSLNLENSIKAENDRIRQSERDACASIAEGMAKIPWTDLKKDNAKRLALLIAKTIHTRRSGPKDYSRDD